MVEFVDRLGIKRQIECERSFKKGWVALKIYNERSKYGDVLEMPLDVFKDWATDVLILAHEDEEF